MAKSNQARVNGGSNYDSLKVAKCLVITLAIGARRFAEGNTVWWCRMLSSPRNEVTRASSHDPWDPLGGP